MAVKWVGNSGGSWESRLRSRSAHYSSNQTDAERAVGILVEAGMTSILRALSSSVEAKAGSDKIFARCKSGPHEKRVHPEHASALHPLPPQPTCTLNSLGCTMVVDLKLPPIPSDLKHVGPFCMRAQEVRARDPIVCYWSLYYVAQLGVKRGRTTENQAFLAAVVEQLEIMKRSLRNRRQITDEAAGSLYVRRFGYNVFQAATNEETHGQANRSTAKKFLAASYFLETLRVFGSLDPEVEETIKYARCKATDIVRTLREGVTPAQGPSAHPPGRATPNGYVVSPSALSPQTNPVVLSGRPSTFASPAESPTAAGRKSFPFQANYPPPPTDAGSGSPVSPRNVQPPPPMFVNPRRAQVQEITKPESVALPSSGSSGQIPLPEPPSPRKLQSPVRERSPLAYMGPTAARNATQNTPKPPSPPKPLAPVIKSPSPKLASPKLAKPPSPKPASPIKAAVPVPIPVTSPVIQQSPEEWPASTIVLTRPLGPTEWPKHALVSPSMGSTMSVDSAETFTSSQLRTVIKGPSSAPRAMSPVKSESAASTERESDEATETEDETEDDEDDDEDESVAESTLMPVLTVVDDPAPKVEIPGAQAGGLVAVASPVVDWDFGREMTEAIGKLTRGPAPFSASPLSASRASPESTSRASSLSASHASPLSVASETPMPESPDLEVQMDGITPAVVIPQSPAQPSPTTPNMRAYSPPTISLHQPQPFKSAAEVIDFSFSKLDRGQEPESIDVEDDEDVESDSSLSSFTSGSEDEAEAEDPEEDSESSDGSSISELTIQEPETKPQELKSRIKGTNTEPTRKTVRFAPSVVGGLSPQVPKQILPPPSSSSPPLQIVPVSAVPQPLARPKHLTIRSSSYDNHQPLVRSPDSPRNGPSRASTLDGDFALVPYPPSMSASHPAPSVHNNPAYAPTANNALVRTTWTSSPTHGPSQPHRVQIDRETASMAQKYSRFAISSLNYMDIEAAKKELRAALMLLEGGDMY